MIDIKLPELPWTGWVNLKQNDFGNLAQVPSYSADQMRAYAIAYGEAIKQSLAQQDPIGIADLHNFGRGKSSVTLLRMEFVEKYPSVKEHKVYLCFLRLMRLGSISRSKFVLTERDSRNL